MSSILMQKFRSNGFLLLMLGLIMVFIPLASYADKDHDVEKKNIYPYRYADKPFVHPLSGDTFSKDSWWVSNKFGNFCHSVPGVLETGHTGEDWLISSSETGGKPVYSINNGVVLWEGLHTSGNGYAVLIKHEAPSGKNFIIPAYADSQTCDTKNDGVSTYSYSAGQRESNTAYSFYLHLGETYVKAGDPVYAGQSIGRLYTNSERVSNGYAYVPHLHFEIWSSLEVLSQDDSILRIRDPQGYDPLSTFRNRLVTMLVSPSLFLGKNNEGPMITGIKRESDNSLTLEGAGFGNYPGSVKITSSGFNDTISSTIWSNSLIKTRSIVSFLTEHKYSFSSLSFVVETQDGQRSNIRTWPFDDVFPEDWFSEDAAYFYVNRLINGYGQARKLSPNPLGPGNNVNFAEFLKILSTSYSFAGGEVTPTTCPTANDPYPVIPLTSPESSVWYCEFYNTDQAQAALAKLASISSGRGKPGQTVSRKEAALILQEFFEYKLISSADRFSDISVSDPFYVWVVSAKNNKLFKGYEDGTFGGDKPILRAEMLKIIKLAIANAPIDK